MSGSFGSSLLEMVEKLKSCSKSVHSFSLLAAAYFFPS